MLKNIKASKESTAAGEGLETLATLPLGRNKSLHLVRAGREIVLLGTAEQAIAPIRRYSEVGGPRAGPDRRAGDGDRADARHAREPRARPSSPRAS